MEKWKEWWTKGKGGRTNGMEWNGFGTLEWTVSGMSPDPGRFIIHVLVGRPVTLDRFV